MALEENDIVEYEQRDTSESGKLLRHYTVKTMLSPFYMHPKVFEHMISKTEGDQFDLTFTKNELGERSPHHIHSIPRAVIKNNNHLETGMLIKSQYMNKKSWGKITAIDKHFVTVDFNSLTAGCDQQFSNFKINKFWKKSDSNTPSKKIPNEVTIHLEDQDISVW